MEGEYGGRVWRESIEGEGEKHTKKRSHVRL